MRKILMVLTSHAVINNTDDTTGVWLGEFTDPYYEFIDKGYEVVLASPLGGEPPVDHRSKLTENITPSNRRFDDDEIAQAAFKTTLKLSEVNEANFDGLFFPGGHGPMWDLANDNDTAKLVLDFYRKSKPIGAVCHGPAALIKAAEELPSLLRDKEVTAFSNQEEKLVGLHDKIPFRLEDKLKSLGCHYDSSTIPFTSNVKVSQLLVTGQNPASAGKTAKKLMKLVEEMASKDVV